MRGSKMDSLREVGETVLELWVARRVRKRCCLWLIDGWDTPKLAEAPHDLWIGALMYKLWGVS